MDRSSTRRPDPVRRRSASKRPIGSYGSHRQSFDEVAAELGRTLDFFKVPGREKDEVLGAFAAHKNEVTAGYTTAATR